MRFDNYFAFDDENEQPLERPVAGGGYTAILRTVGCIGDSLSSGEFESTDAQGNKGYHDMFEYSWGQFIARDTGCTVYNFSRGGMTAKEYMESFAGDNGFWDDDKLCRAYILALGVNDIINAHMALGNVSDIDLADWRNNKKTFAGYYAAIVQRLKEKRPDARFFFVTMPKDENGTRSPGHTALLHAFTKVFEHSYVIDLDRWAPPHDEAFRRRFYLGGHLNAAGYLLTAKQMEAYIDWIIRHNADDFAQIGFVGTPWRNLNGPGD